MKNYATGLLLAGLLCFTGAATQAQRVPLSDSELASEWYLRILQTIRITYGFTPPVSSRTLAYMSLAFYESIQTADGPYASLSGQLNGYKRPAKLLPKTDAALFLPACANGAFARMSGHLFESATFVYMRRLVRLRDSVNQVFLDAGIDPQLLERSNQHGAAVADLVFEWSKNDGGHQGFLHTYDIHYQTAATCDSCWVDYWKGWRERPVLHPYWGNNRTFLAENAKGFGLRPKYRFSTEPGSEFYRQVAEVMHYAKKENYANEDEFLMAMAIARFWDDSPITTFTPSGHYVLILTNILKESPRSLHEAAGAYALLSIALADAVIATWKCKFETNLIRPITYIQRYIEPEWYPLLQTPPFPEFPSGHSAHGGAFWEVMTALFGENYTFTDLSRFTYKHYNRTFNSFEEAAREASLSRLYGGIHYRDALDQGLVLGRMVGKNVLKIRTKK